MVLHFSFLFFCGGGSSRGGVGMFRSSFFRSFSSFGVCGSRVSGSLACSAASVVVPFVAGIGAVSCGCASGVDAVARPLASLVFRASSFGRGRWAFVARSVAFVRALAVSPRPVLLVFPSGACPSGLVPSRFSSRCFCGLVSGSWASCAFAVGLGVPVVVFGVSRSCLPSWAGSWVPVSVASVSGFVFVPSQALLF